MKVPQALTSLVIPKAYQYKKEGEMTKIINELRCACCGKKLSSKQPLFDTAWSGVYWCGDPECANWILQGNCTELDATDECNRE